MRRGCVLVAVLAACSPQDRSPTGHVDRPAVTVAGWSSSPAIAARNGFADSFVVLPSGRILAAGGSTSIEYDPTTNAWSATSTMIEPQIRPALTVLPSGKVLAAGSITSPSGDSHEFTLASLYDPATRTWSKTTNLPRPAALQTFATLTDGRPILVGVYDSTSSLWIGTDIYAPATGTWSKGPDLPYELYYVRTVALGTKRLFLSLGGAAALLDLSSVSWTASPNGPTSAGLAAIDGTSALAVGSTGARIFRTTTNAWTAAATPPSDNIAVAAARLSNGRILVAGGQSPAAPSTGGTTTQIYDPVTDSWGLAGSLGESRRSVSVPAHEVLTFGDRAVVIGNQTNYTTADRFDLLGLGVDCAGGYECKSAACVDGVCCSTASCASGSTCAAVGSKGTCIKKTGTGCSAGTECATGLCVDGVCCATSCTGQCEACSVTGSAGTCTAVVGAPKGSRAACGGVGAGGTCGASCNGVERTKCTFPGATTACGSATCTAGVESHVAACDGAGKCGDTPKSCGVYACGTTACKTTCSAATDCVGGYYCKAGSCVAVEGLGKDCTKASDCSTGFCVDGVCCGVASCPADSACNAKSSAKGVCAKVVGSTCTLGTECGSGLCVDGVCCGSACEGQCEACDVPGHLGTCWPVSGAPHGGRSACGAGTDCASPSCDGAKDPTKCVGAKVDLEKVCAPARCEGSKYYAATRCDADGSCPKLVGTSCVPYACGAAGCLPACKDDAECASGYVCQDGKCGPRRASCSADRREAIDESGRKEPCSPYLCKDGYCERSCASSDQCTDGTACNTALGRCEPVAAPSEVAETGGCTVPARSGSSSRGAELLAGVCLLLVLRRRTS